MLSAVLAGFLMAVLAPWLARVFRGASGWIFALVPLGQLAFFLSHLPGIRAGEQFRPSDRWVPALDLTLSFHLDGLALLFAVLISGMGALIVIYAGSYLAGDRRSGVFQAFLFMFMGAMLGLVLADNLITMFMFWELTSISSYLLIGFDHQRPAARAAALQALLVTGGGGLALLAGLILLGLSGGSFELSVLLDRGYRLPESIYLPVLLLILLGALTKSAQFPFHFWLPNAMAAPTPASAYLHSATMVKAGIYLLARLNPILGNTPAWLTIVTVLGAATTLLGAYRAFRSTDLKGILAYSTLSVLGTLTMLLGVGSEFTLKAAIAMLIAHAFYKGALFLVAGAIDHATHERDIQNLAGLARAMPITAFGAAVAGLSMAGVIPTFGFIAKELYYEAVLASPGVEQRTILSFLVSAVALAASALLVAVAGLICIKPFVGAKSAAAEHAHEAPFGLWLPPVVLGLLGLTFGLAPQRLADLLVPAVASVAGRPVEVKLVLLHPINIALIMSMVTLAVGVGLYVLRHWFVRFERADRLFVRVGPGQWYQWALDALNGVAKWQTSVLQNGYLRFYLLTIAATTVVLVWLVLANGLIPQRAIDFRDMRFYEVLLAFLVLGGTVVAVRATSRLVAVAGLGVVGYSVAMIFVLFSAPDLAMTQAVIETLTVTLFVLVLYHLPHYKTLSTPRERWRDGVVALGIGATMTALLLFAGAVPSADTVSAYYAKTSVPEGHGRNIVNVILVDFRALDTLAEITVLAIAGVGAYALLKLRPKRRTPVSTALLDEREDAASMSEPEPDEKE